MCASEEGIVALVSSNLRTLSLPQGPQLARLQLSHSWGLHSAVVPLALLRRWPSRSPKSPESLFRPLITDIKH